MLEIWKALIDHVLSWPIAAVVLGLVFKRHISDLLARATRLSLKHGSTSLEASAGESVASDQAEKIHGANPSALLSAGGEEKHMPNLALQTIEGPLFLPETPVDEDLRRQMIDFGKGIASVQIREELIRDHLAKMRFELNTAETTEILIRNLAVNQALAEAERLYRLIFGSQIALLKRLNIQVQTDAEMKVFYEKAQKKYPKFYGDYSYQQWREFLVGQRLIVYDAERNVYGINQAGRDFLSWIIGQGLTEAKWG